MKLRHLRSALIAAAVIPVVSQYVRAATPTDYFWNAPMGGSGAWDNSTPDWATTVAGPVNYTWTSSGNERANFNNTGGVVTIGAGGVTAYGINFGVTGYTIAGNTLSLAGTGGPIFSNLAATISAPIAGSAGLTKTGSGTLSLTAANGYTGGTTIYTSTIVGTAQSSGSPISSGAVNLNMGALNLKGIAGPPATTTTIGDLTVGTAFDNSNGGGSGVSNVIVDSSATGATTTLAAGNLVRGGVGSVLAITPQTGSLGTNENLTFTGGTALTNGILPAWVAAQTSGSSAAVDFVTYGGSGVAPATYSKSDVTASSNTDTVNENNTPVAVTGNVAAYALKTNQAINLGTNMLTVGNGTGQSGLILNGGSVTNGNITFGSTEGMIYLSGTAVVGSLGNNITSNALTITGSGATTATFNGNIVDSGSTPVQITSAISPTTIVLNGTNTYSGGTVLTVNTGTTGNIVLGNDSAFGGGKVTVNIVPGTSSPQIQASSARTLANAFDLNSGLVFTGTNSIAINGPINIINAAASSRTIQNTISNTGNTTVTFGSSGSPSTISLGNPVSNGGDGVGKTLLFSPNASTTMVINDVIQDPHSGTPGSVQYGGANAGVVVINAVNTYSGGTSLAGPNSIIQFSTDSNGTGGPFGTGTITTTSTSGSINFLQPVGGNRIIANAVVIGAANLTVNNATGDTSSVTFTGPISMQTAGKTINNNMTSPATLTFGSSGNPSTFTLATTSGQTLGLAGTGTTVYNDTIQDSGGNATAISIGTAASVYTFNGAITSNGTISITAANTVTFNGTRSGTGGLSTSGASAGTLNLNSTGSSYSGGTTLADQGEIVTFGASSNALPGASFTTGPLGTGTVTVNNTTSNPHFRPVGGNQSISNAVVLTSGVIVDNATGDTTSNFTFAGPISLGGTGRTLNNSGSGGVTLGASSAPSTITLATATGQPLFLQIQAGSAVINDTIVNSGAFAGQVTVNSTAGSQFPVTWNDALSTYTGGTQIGGGAIGGGIMILGASSNALPGGSFTAGPFGTGTLNVNNSQLTSGIVPNFEPAGADRLISNAVTLSSGMFASTITGDPHNLTFAGNITTTGKVITSNMATGTALYLGTSGTTSTFSTSGISIFQNNQSLTSNIVMNDALSGAGGITVKNGALLLVNGQASYTGATLVSQDAGTMAPSLTYAKSFTSGSTVTVSGGKLFMASDGSHDVVLATNTLAVTGTGKVDLTNNKLVVRGSTNGGTGTLGTPTGGIYTAGSVQGLVQSGLNGGSWNGTTGIITSSATPVSGQPLMTLGTGVASDLSKSTFGNVAVSNNDVLVMYTYGGDMTLDGVVNGDDYVRIDQGFGSMGALTGYENGDLNYDGKINAADYFIIDSNYSLQGSPIADGPVIGGAPTVGLSGVSAVPEPGSLGVGLASLGMYLGSRRRRRR